jgi:hypothetical protein
MRQADVRSSAAPNALHRSAPLACAALAALGLLTASSPAAAERSIRHLNREAATRPGQEVHINFPIGELRVVGTGDDKVSADLDIRCQKRAWREDCDDAAERVELVIDNDDDRLSIDFRGYPRLLKDDSKISLHGTIRVPAKRPLIVEMNIGELDIEGVAADLEANLHIGELSIEAPGRGFGSAALDAGIGEATLRTPDGWIEGDRSFLIGSEVSWRRGSGRDRIRADVGIGEIEVRLTE